MQEKLLTGNEAAAQAVYMAAQVLRTQADKNPRDRLPCLYVAGYPITPQTQIIEKLSEWLKDEPYASYNNLESEHSVMAACVGASLAGARTFTASSSHGLLLMAEMLHWAAKAGAPIVMANVNRAIGPPWNIWSDQSDSLSCRDCGWIQFYCESPQEVFDSILVAFALAEDPRILTPVMVCLDGFLISHTAELVKLPTLEQVNEFLPLLDLPHKVIENGATFGSSSTPYNHSLIEKNRRERMALVGIVEREIVRRFEGIFGYQALPVEAIFPQDHTGFNTDFQVVVMGGLSRYAKEAIKILQNDFSLGLTRIRRFIPFPKSHIRRFIPFPKSRIASLKKSKKIIVLNNSPMEILTESVCQSFVGISEAPPIVSRMVGISGTDVSSDFLASVIKEAIEIGSPDDPLDKRWQVQEPKKLISIPSSKEPAFNIRAELEAKDLFVSGHRACQGCGAAIALKRVVNFFGENSVLVIPASCSSIIVGPYPHSPLRVPVIHTAFSTTGAVAGAIKNVCEIRDPDKEIVVIGWAGDGGTADIGLQALSAAAESGKKIIYICYDNEAYMNTGRQRSSLTPFGAETETTPGGNLHFKKDLMRIMAAHNIPYAATCSIAFLDDLNYKLEKAKEKQKQGLCFLHILCPCPPGWKYEPCYSIKLARLAVLSDVWPLYEIEDGRRYKITYIPRLYDFGLDYADNVDVLEEYLNMQGRFKNLSVDDKRIIRQHIEGRLEFIQRQEGLKYRIDW